MERPILQYGSIVAREAGDMILASAVFSLLLAPGPVCALTPEELGPDSIDVSEYPAEYRKTYEEIFIPLFRRFGGAARVVNSPVIELDPASQSYESKRNPILFSDSEVAQVSTDGWKKQVDAMRRRPPCCGACPVLSLQGAKDLWRFLVYDSIVRKTGPRAQNWVRQRRSLLGRFKKERPLFKRTQEAVR